MKARIKHLLVMLALTACLGLMSAGRVTAQTFTTLHTFTALVSETNSDGAQPYAGLILSGNTLYGTTTFGGAIFGGTVFAINTNGTGFTNLFSFNPVYTNDDGAQPYAGLILSGDTLYGTAEYGGTNGFGTVFALSTNGTSFNGLHNFMYLSATDGCYPLGGLVLSGSTLYGTTEAGGVDVWGNVFTVSTNGTNFTILHTFGDVDRKFIQGVSVLTNGDGYNPAAGLILSGNTLYGTAEVGGTNGAGTVFALNTNGNSTALHHFTAIISRSGLSGNLTNSDGANPVSGLILSGNTLYGTAQSGGTYGNGTVFSVSNNGTSFTLLHTFGPTNNPNSTNSDGANPVSGLILSGNTLYGTAQHGGTNGNGTVFSVSTTGTNFTTLYTFTATSGSGLTNSDGANPCDSVILSGNTLYGTAQYGGTNGDGTVFSISLGSVTVTPPQLVITQFGTNVILTWPTNATGFTLQFTTNLAPPAVWSTNSSAPVIANTNNAVTNSISGTQKFYRLSQ